jgi:hypothetical protein
METTPMTIPRIAAERQAQDQRLAEAVLDHPISAEFPKAAVEALAVIADGQPMPDGEGAHRLVMAALAAIVEAEILALRRAQP